MKNRNYRYRNRRNKSSRIGNSLISTIITGIAGMVTKDLLSENSKIKGFIKSTFQTIKIDKKSNGEIPNSKQVIEGSYSVLDETPETEEKNKTNWR